MKKSVLIIAILGALKAPAVTPASMKTDLSGERPSCGMLAWRWVNTLARFTEREQILKETREFGDYQTLKTLAERIPGGTPEESANNVIQKVTFKISGARASNVRITEIDTPIVRWKNVSENLTDLISIKVEEGLITVIAPISYGDYCFARKSSKIFVEINGRAQTLFWGSQRVDLDRYMKLLERI